MTTLELIKKELKELSPVLKELELPTINYTFNSENDNSIAYCHALVYRRWLVVTDVEFSGQINFDPIAIDEYVKQVFPIFMHSIALRYIIRQCILHEHRHAWQYINKKDMCIKHHSSMDMGFMYGHGTSDIEEDANQYAISKACNNEELDMFKYQRLLQRYSALSTKEERIALDKYYNKFAKKYTLPKVAKTGIAIAACTAIGYMLLNKRRK